MNIQSVTFQSANIAAQKHFFEQVLEMTIASETDTTLSIQVGTSLLNFVQSDDIQPTHYAFDIPENQFAAAKDWLSKRVPLLANSSGVTEFHSVDWNADMIYFEDADGNIGEFIARHNLSTSRMMPFNSDSLVRISEVGLVTPHVVQTVADLREQAGLKAWRGAGSETFTAVGDENGLLIVVQEGRTWMPNQTLPAQIAPFEIILDSGNDFAVPNLPYTFKVADTANI